MDKQKQLKGKPVYMNRVHTKCATEGIALLRAEAIDNIKKYPGGGGGGGVPGGGGGGGWGSRGHRGVVAGRGLSEPGGNAMVICRIV